MIRCPLSHLIPLLLPVPFFPPRRSITTIGYIAGMLFCASIFHSCDPRRSFVVDDTLTYSPKPCFWHFRDDSSFVFQLADSHLALHLDKWIITVRWWEEVPRPLSFTSWLPSFAFAMRSFAVFLPIFSRPPLIAYVSCFIPVLVLIFADPFVRGESYAFAHPLFSDRLLFSGCVPPSLCAILLFILASCSPSLSEAPFGLPIKLIRLVTLVLALRCSFLLFLFVALVSCGQALFRFAFVRSSVVFVRSGAISPLGIPMLHVVPSSPSCFPPSFTPEIAPFVESPLPL